MKINKLKDFDKDFLWGASLSAFQAEGAYDVDGRKMSIMDLKTNPKYASFHDGVDFYHTYKQDIALFKQMGLKSLRFSISWSRIYPDGDGQLNEKGIEFYNNLIDELIKNDIEPIVTIYHFDLPLSLEQRGGWNNRELIVGAYVNYAKTLFKFFHQKVKYWITFNEQNVMVLLGSKKSMINPNKASQTDKEIYQASHHMFIAQAMVVNYLHQFDPNAKIGPALNNVPIYPNSNDPKDYLAAMNGSVVRNWYYLDAIVRGEYNPIMKTQMINHNYYPEILDTDWEILKNGKPDFLAINYYTSATAQDDAKNPDQQTTDQVVDQQKMFDVTGMYQYVENPHLPDTEYGWNIDAIGLRIILREMYERYRLPIMITENGIGVRESLNENNSVDDDYRIDYYQQHLLAIQQAISEGIEVIGYNPWTALDIVSSHQGISKRYGFIYVDRNETDLKQLKRYPKKSFYWYQKVIDSNGQIR